jgi:hypothetical protein
MTRTDVERAASARGRMPGGVALALALAALVLIVYAARAPRAVAPALTDRAWDRWFDSVERDPAGEPFRWMRSRGAIPLPRLSTAPHLLTLALENARPDGKTVAAQVTQGAQLDFAVAPGRRTYTLLLPGSAAPTPNLATLSADTFQPTGDRRALSLVVRGAALAPAGPGLPWWAVTAAGALAQVALLALLLRSLGVPQQALPAAAALPLLYWWPGAAAYGAETAVLAWTVAAGLGVIVAVRHVSAGAAHHEIQARPWGRADYVLAGGFAAAAVALRVALIPRQIPLLNGDDYLTGSFAANILLRGWHALYYGHHTGALASYLVVPVMAVGGISTTSLLALPIALTAVLTVALYGIGNDIAGRWGGAAAALWVAAPAATALWWTLKPQPGYLEAITFGALALWGTVRLLWGEHSRRGATMLMTGVAAAATLAFWAGMVIASVLLVCGGLALLRWRRLPGLPAAGYGLSAATGLLLLVPTAVYIVQRPGDNPLWWVVGRDMDGLPPATAFAGLVERVLPLALGVARPWPMGPVEPWAAVAILGLAAAGAAAATWAALGASRGALVPVGLAAAVTALFCLSSFNLLLSDVRYVLPLYIALPLFAALLVSGARRVAGPWAAAGLLALLAATNLWSGLGGMLTVPPATGRSETAVARALAEEGIAHVHSSYWIAQPLMVESGGRILASAQLGPTRESYDRRVEDAVLIADPAQVALLVRAGGIFEGQLDAYLFERRIACRKRVAGRITIYLGCTPFPDLADLQRRIPAGLYE